MSSDQALKALGAMVDEPFFNKTRPDHRKAIELLEYYREKDLTKKEECISHYFSGVAWGDLHSLEDKSSLAWNWEQPNIIRQLVHYRTALNLSKFCNIQVEYKIYILVNLGNTLTNVGRFIEALDCLNEAVDLNPNFYLSRANRGKVLLDYSRHIHDDGHSNHLSYRALQEIETALLTKWVNAYSQQKTALMKTRNYLEQGLTRSSVAEILEQENKINKEEWDSTEETEYRLWCLTNRLFLNPLNDVPNPYGCYDTIGCPSIIGHELEPDPIFHRMFNQIIQEYTTARYSYFLGISSDSTHFCDRDVKILNTFDSSLSCYPIEHIKMSFRSIYLLFDKISFLLNHYGGLGIDHRFVSFRRLWYYNGDRNKDIWPHLKSCRNWPLRGLFWVSKDLYEKRGGFDEAADPTAK